MSLSRAAPQSSYRPHDGEAAGPFRASRSPGFVSTRDTYALTAHSNRQRPPRALWPGLSVVPLRYTMRIGGGGGERPPLCGFFETIYLRRSFLPRSLSTAPHYAAYRRLWSNLKSNLPLLRGFQSVSRFREARKLYYDEFRKQIRGEWGELRQASMRICRFLNILKAAQWTM